MSSNFTWIRSFTLTRHRKKRRTISLMVKHLRKAFFIKRKCRMRTPTPHPGLGVLSGQGKVSPLKGIHFGRSVLKFVTVGGTMCHWLVFIINSITEKLIRVRNRETFNIPLQSPTKQMLSSPSSSDPLPPQTHTHTPQKKTAQASYEPGYCLGPEPSSNWRLASEPPITATQTPKPKSAASFPGRLPRPLGQVTLIAPGLTLCSFSRTSPKYGWGAALDPSMSPRLPWLWRPQPRPGRATTSRREHAALGPEHKSAPGNRSRPLRSRLRGVAGGNGAHGLKRPSCPRPPGSLGPLRYALNPEGSKI